MLAAASKWKPDTIVILGDFVDFYAVSSHDKDPKRATMLDDELKKARAALKQLCSLQATRKIYICGNHEYRLTRYLRTKAPELHDVVTIDSLLGLTENGFEVVEYKKYMNIGKVYFTHDVGSAGKFAHYRASETFQRNIIVGHTHRFASAIEGSIEGIGHTAASFGWLGDRKTIDYMSEAKVIKDWYLGFGVVHILESGDAHIQGIPIIHDTCILEGVVTSLKKPNILSKLKAKICK